MGNGAYLALAEKCAQLEEEKDRSGSQGQRKWRVDQLGRWLEGEECQARELLGTLRRVQNCEPFLLVLLDCFDALLASPGKPLSELARGLAAVQQEISERAAAFSTLSTVIDSPRMTQILELARLAQQGDREEFLGGILRHHQGCMEARRRDSLVLVEGERLVVSTPAERGMEEILTRLRTGTPWENDYYLWNAGTIYQQLFMEDEEGGVRG